MKPRAQLEKKIQAEDDEINQLKAQLLKHESFLEGLREALKLLPRENQESATQVLRPGSDMAKARKFLKSVAQPLYIDEILKGIGKPVTGAIRASFAGSIGTYVRKGLFFKKTAPNTFGLIEDAEEGSTNGKGEIEPPF